MGSLLLSPGPGVHKTLCVPSKSGVSVSPSPVEVLQSTSDSLGILSPVAGPTGWRAWHGAQNLHSSGRTSVVYLFSSLWVTHPAGMGFDFIMIELFLSSHCSFSFVFGCGVSFFVGSIFLSMVVQPLVVILVLLQEEVSSRPSTLPSWTNLLLNSLYIFDIIPCQIYGLQIFFSHSVGCLFPFYGFLAVQMLFSLMKSHFFIFAFVSLAWGEISRKVLLRMMSKSVLLMFSSKGFMVSCLTFKSLIHFKLIFVYGVR